MLSFSHSKYPKLPKIAEWAYLEKDNLEFAALTIAKSNWNERHDLALGRTFVSDLRFLPQLFLKYWI